MTELLQPVFPHLTPVFKHGKQIEWEKQMLSSIGPEGGRDSSLSCKFEFRMEKEPSTDCFLVLDVKSSNKATLGKARNAAGNDVTIFVDEAVVPGKPLWKLVFRHNLKGDTIVQMKENVRRC